MPQRGFERFDAADVGFGRAGAHHQADERTNDIRHRAGGDLTHLHELIERRTRQQGEVDDAPSSIAAFMSRVRPNWIETLWPLACSNNGKDSDRKRRIAPPLMTLICDMRFS